MAVTISGTLRNASGVRPNTKIILTATRTSNTVLQHAPDISITTDANGEYSFDCNPAAYVLSIQQDGYRREVVGAIMVYSDSIPGTLEDFILAPKAPDLTPEIVKQVEELRNEAEQFANQAAASAQEAKDAAASIPENAMSADAYDPQSIASDAFSRANHTGEQSIDTVTNLRDNLEALTDFDRKVIEDIYTASGHINLGKHGVNNINQGLTASSEPYRYTLGGTLGDSKTSMPVLNIAGYRIEATETNIDFPSASSDPAISERYDIWGYEFNSVDKSLTIRTIAGSGNGPWENTDCTSGLPLRWDASNVVKSLANGANFVNSDELGVFEDGSGAYFLFCGERPSMNQGCYHQSFNPFGAARATDGFWWQSSLLNNKQDCFTHASGGSMASGISGRDDGAFYDEARVSGVGGIIDGRYEAIDKSSSDDASLVTRNSSSGEYRGVESLAFTTVNLASLSGRATLSPLNDYVGILQFNVDFETDGPVWIEQSGGDYFEYFATAQGNGNISVDASLQAIDRFEGQHIIYTYKSNLNVESEFSCKDVISDPSKLIQVDALNKGWFGYWIPDLPNGSMSNWLLSRKALSAKSCRP